MLDTCSKISLNSVCLQQDLLSSVYLKADNKSSISSFGETISWGPLLSKKMYYDTELSTKFVSRFWAQFILAIFFIVNKNWWDLSCRGITTVKPFARTLYDAHFFVSVLHAYFLINTTTQRKQGDQLAKNTNKQHDLISCWSQHK